jgi:glycerol-3-phosphate dehydrogenase (NAD(P)+)
MSKQVAVLVAGSWGTALASVLAANGCAVNLWTRRSEQAEEINTLHTNRQYLTLPPKRTLSTQIVAHTDIERALHGVSAVVLAAPTSAMRAVARAAAPFIRSEQVLVHVAKGFERQSLKRMSQVIGEEIAHYPADRITVLSGPSHAEEVIVKNPTTVVVAAAAEQAANQALQLFLNDDFRVYLNHDMLGVELAGAMKNTIALAAGMCDGLRLGDNAKAALVTRGLAEISAIGIEMGAKKETYFGLAGLGDLIVTCGSLHSRNYRAGKRIGEGATLTQLQAESGMVVEGINTTKASFDLARQYGVNMPITEQLYHVLFEEKDPRTAVYDLMTRDVKRE